MRKTTPAPEPRPVWWHDQRRDLASQRPVGPGAPCWCAYGPEPCDEWVKATARVDARYRDETHRMHAAWLRRRAVVQRSRATRRRAPRFEGGRPRIAPEIWRLAKAIAAYREISVSELLGQLTQEERDRLVDAARPFEYNPEGKR